MADYGHDLTFGTFLTPQNQRPDAVVALAQLTERAGLDLATFQDHPYQSAFLDTWTLLSWVAAQTTTLRVAPNVLNVPLRPPAVVGRAAASLDLLSGGRLELGLGAGGFWDAIVAMGAPRRAPGESVTQLSEAIDVLRQMWDVAERGGVRVDGEHIRVRGAKRGPEPAHDIALWIGAYKPRMLALTGAKGDGWLPSLAYLPLADVPAANARIDEAAAQAGRDPREIRRLLNISGSFGARGDGFLQGPPEQWVQQLLPLVLEHGFSTFILASDDPHDIEVYGAEVAPGLREAVARERGSGTGAPPSGPVRGPRALAARRPGIDYDAVPEALAATAVEPGDRDYGKVRSTYIHRGTPGLVLRPQTAEQVAEALTYAREQDVPLAVRSGGHGLSGRATNDGGVVVDVGALDEITMLDPATGRVRLGPGARWGHVAQALARHGLAISSGDYGDVGVGGLATAGGVGLLVRQQGLTLDRVRAAELVLADGRHVRPDDDLLWAIRGAGGHFGIVTALELEAAPLGDVVFATMAFDGRDAAGLLERWGAVVESAPRALTSFLHLFGGAQPIVQLSSVFAGDDADAASEALSPLLGIGTVLEQQAQLLPYPAVVAPHGGVQRGGMSRAAFRAGLVDHLTPELAERAAQLVARGDAQILQIRPVGGAVHDTPADATAFAHRTQEFGINAVGAGALDQAWDAAVGPFVTGLYTNFDGDPRPERLHEAFPAATLTRLRELKAAYDPDGVFRQSFAIPPAVPAAA